MDTLKLRLLNASYQPPFVTVAANTPVGEAIHLMSQGHASCVLVIEQQELVGIFTERDVVRAIANQTNLADMTITQVMVQPVITLSETEVEDLNTVLQKFRQHDICHLPVINAQGQVLGMITPVLLRDALQPSDLFNLRTVADVMETDVMSAPPMVAVQSLAEMMITHHISCVVIVEAKQQVNSEVIPIGIVTQRDIVNLQSQGLDLVSTPAAEVMSDRLVTVAPQASLWSAYQTMQTVGIPRVVVTGNNGELLGILSQSSVLKALDPTQLCEVITLLQQIIDTKTAELAQQIRQREQMSNLLLAREAHYHASQARLNDILNSAIANSIVSFRLFSNYDWEYEYQSPGCEAIFGYTSSEIMQNKHLWMSRVHPQDIETVIMPLFADILAGITANVEFRFYHKDDSLRWIAATYTSRHDSDHNCWIVTGISNDISQRKQAEVALRESEQRWQLAIAGTDEAIWDWDILTNQTFRSDCWYKMLGYERHELSNWDNEWSKRLHPDDYQRVMADQEAYLQRQVDSYNCEYRLRLKDDSYAWFRSCAKAVWDEQGNPVRLVGSMGDISDRKRIETQLLQTANQYRLLFETNPNPMWIFDLETLRFLAVNQSAILKYGYSESEFLSMILADIRLLDQFDYLHNMISNFKCSSSLIFVCEAKHWKRDGTIIDVEINSHRITWHNKAAGFVLIKDITAEKTALRDRQHSQALLEEAQRVARLGNWEYNLATGKINWSKQLFNLYDREPEQSEPSYDELLSIFHPEDAEKLNQAVKRVISTGESYKLLLRVIKPDNAIMYVEAIGQADFNADGKIVRLYGTTQDITERIQAEARLRQSEARLVTTQKIAHVGSWEVDFNTNQRSWSTETFEIFGLNPHQAEPTHAEFIEMVHPEDRAAVQTQFTQVIAHGKPFCLEYRIIRPDGSIRYLESRAEVAEDSPGKVSQLFGAILDITERQQAEAALARSEEQLRLTLEFTHIGTWDWNIQTGEVVWNDNHYRLLGLEPSKSKAQYQIWRNAVHPEDIEGVEQLISQALSQYTNFEAEYRVIHPDGQIRWLTGRGRGIYNTADKPIRMLGIIIDISDRKFAEQALQEKETFLRSIYNSVGQAIFVVDVINNDFRYVGLNHSHEVLTGLKSNELNGKTPEEILPPNLAAIIRQHYQDCIDAGDTITYEESLHFQGQQTWWITTLTPLKDQNSRIYRIVGNSVNISDRKRTEQILELQAVITRNMAEGICLVRSDDSVIVYTNPKFEQMFGYESGALIGHHVSIVNYEDGQINTKSLHEVIAANIMQYGEITYEVQNIKKNGTCFWSSATSSVFEHPEYGTVFVTVQQDITEQKKAEEKIKASLKEKEVLLKEIHHRVKNNLGIVSSLLQMQYRRTQDPQATAILLDSKNRIASIALVHEKLYRSDDLANINFAQYIPDLTTHLFDSYNVSSTHIQLNIQVEDVNLDIETAIPCGLIINELVSNALKYAFPVHQNGEIQVSLFQASDDTLTLIIRDNGVGLPAEFESKKTKTLGMTLIQGLVKQLRGTLEINSQQGTEFKICFTAARV